MENLAYWNLRAVEARIVYYEFGSKKNREELLFCRRMVNLVESLLFFGKDVL